MMKALKYVLGLLLATGISGSALAQTSSPASDSLSRRIHQQDSIATAQDLRTNAVTLTDSATRASIRAALTSLAATTTPPAPANVDSSGISYPNSDGRRLIYDTGNIIDVLRHPKPGLTAVVAHRGYFQAYGVPENSLLAIQRASDANLEMVELDIKMSSDGVPVLSHDMTVGRTTVGGRGNYKLVSSFTNGELQTFRLKDKNGNSTNEYMRTLEQALDYIHDHRIAIVVALDIKDRNAARACWEIVKRKQNAWNNPAYNWVIFKMNATVYNYPADLVYDLKGLVKPLDPANPGGRWVKDFYYDKLLYIPVYTTNMSDKLDCLDSFRQFSGQPMFVAVEINFKQGGGLLTELMVEAYRDRMAGNEHTKCIFNALPDATSEGSDRFWSADGYHTYRLQDLYWPPAGKPAWNGKRDTDDKRGDWDFLIDDPNNFKMITTDLPNALAGHLASLRKRNTNYYRPHPDGTADEVDPHSTDTGSTANRLTASALRVEAPAASTLGVYPNPTAGNLTVGLNQAKEGVVQFRVTDQQGRTVLSQQRTLPAGAQQVTLPNLRASGARPGLYLLQVTPAGGQPRQTFKVQIN